MHWRPPILMDLSLAWFLIPFKLGWRMDGSTSASVDILVEDRITSPCCVLMIPPTVIIAMFTIWWLSMPWTSTILWVLWITHTSEPPIPPLAPQSNKTVQNCSWMQIQISMKVFLLIGLAINNISSDLGAEMVVGLALLDRTCQISTGCMQTWITLPHQLELGQKDENPQVEQDQGIVWVIIFTISW